MLSDFTNTAKDTNEKSLIEKMKASGKKVVVFFGSQTGTAEEFAQRLVKNARLYGIKACVADPEEVDLEDIQRLKEIENSVAVFIMATYGEGDPTDNAHDLNEWLQQDHDLSGLNFAVFGLGNKTYEHFNAVGKHFDKRLAELNANRLVPLGLGDDDANIEEDFVTWVDKFYPVLCDHLGVSGTEQDVSIRQYKLVNVDDVPTDKLFRGEISRLKSYEKQRPPFDSKNPFLAPIIENRNLCKDGDRKCLHIVLDITGSRLKYEAGDHVAIYPSNDSELVDRIGELLNVDLDQAFSLVNIESDASKKHPFPCPTTYRVALTNYLDITSTPTTQLLKEFAQYASDEKEKAQLQLMGSSSEEGKNQYNTFIRDNCVDLLTLLELMPSLKPPIDHVLELLPRLQVRYYSISSSPKIYPNQIHVTASVLEYKTKLGRIRKGVCTNWLASKIPTEEIKPKVPIFVRKSTFRLPFKFQTPVIMIGPGTGLAPFRGFIQERDYYLKEGRLVGETALYFGCRNKAADYIYEEELVDYEQRKSITLHVAFSRDQLEKVYVTHYLQKHASKVWNLLSKENGHIYVCGDAKNMARDVNEILINICKTEGQMTHEVALNFIKDLGQKSRYMQDVWS